MDFTLTFLRMFSYGLYLFAPLLLTLIALIILLGQRVGKQENWTRYDALYWTLITATTVGYGDFRPAGKISKALAVLITVTGLICTGIIVAVALQSAIETIKSHQDVEALKKTIEALKH